MYKITSVENQRKCILPMNDISATIFYDKRIIISAPIPEPITWKCSKVEQVAPKGISHLTFAQDKFNSHTDYIEKDEMGNVVGMWANYFTDDGTKPSDSKPSEVDIHSVITYVGKATIKAGGSFKKLTVNFYDGETPIDFKLGQWSFEINGVDASSLLETDITDLEQNQIKVRFIGSEDYMGKTLKVIYSSTTGVISSVDILITGA